MNHFHLIYTPKGLAELQEESLSLHERYVSYAELGAGGLHFHTYIETTYSKDTTSDKLKAVQRVPPGNRGKKSLHYSNREVARVPPGHPDQDLRKFTLGYIQKHGTQKYCKGFKEIELREALEYYNSNKARVPPGQMRATHEESGQCAAEGGAGRSAEQTDRIVKDTVQEKWLEFQIAMLKGVQKPTGEITTSHIDLVDIKFFKKKAWGYWKKRCNGLFPPAAERSRFLISVWAAYLDIIQQDVNLDEVKENLGY